MYKKIMSLYSKVTKKSIAVMRKGAWYHFQPNGSIVQGLKEVGKTSRGKRGECNFLEYADCNISKEEFDEILKDVIITKTDTV